MNSPRDRPRNTTSWPGGGISQRKRRAQAIGATSSGMPNASNIAIPTTVRYVPAYASQMPIIVDVSFLLMGGGGEHRPAPNQTPPRLGASRLPRVVGPLGRAQRAISEQKKTPPGVVLSV